MYYTELLSLTIFVSTVLSNDYNIRTPIRNHFPSAIVPYYIETSCYDSIVSELLLSVLRYIESESCVKFKSLASKEEAGDTSWLHFVNRYMERKCVHQPEYRDDGEIVVVLGYECLQRTQLLHSVLHALGLRDEVTHPRRNQFIKVLWRNIQPEFFSLFLKDKEESVLFKLNYDPFSVMHFHDFAFSANGRATIKPRLPGLIIKPSELLSHLDQMKLHLLFYQECNSRDVIALQDSCKVALKNNGSIDSDSYNSISGANNDVSGASDGISGSGNIQFEPKNTDQCYKNRRRQLLGTTKFDELNDKIEDYMEILGNTIKVAFEKQSRDTVIGHLHNGCTEYTPKSIKNTVKRISNSIKKTAYKGLQEVKDDFSNLDLE